MYSPFHIDLLMTILVERTHSENELDLGDEKYEEFRAMGYSAQAK